MPLYERKPRTLLDRILFRPGRLTERAQRRADRRTSDDAYRAAARAQVVRVCRDCRHGVAPAGALSITTALWQPMKDGVYLHVDSRACWYFVSRSVSFIAVRVFAAQVGRALKKFRRAQRARRLAPDEVWARRHPING